MFQPVVPAEGLVGWRFLQRTYDAQRAVFGAQPQIERDTQYFEQKIAGIQSAEELVADRRLLSVALGAFGLQDDIANRYFIRKVLEEGTVSDDTLANRLSDTRYREMAAAFGFGPGEARQTARAGFGAEIAAKFEANSFEVAAGAQNDAMRVALYARRTLPALAADDGSVNAKWFTVMGDPPMRRLFERALNLPPSIGQIDIDQQLDIFKDRARAVFGTDTFEPFRDAGAVEDAITKFIVRDQLNGSAAGLTGMTIALTLLQR